MQRTGFSACFEGGQQQVVCMAAFADVAAFRAQRVLLWQRRNTIVQPFGETVQQVFARISALRDSLDGPQAKSPCVEMSRRT